MNLIELRDRLTDIIEDNKLRGWEERNTSDVVVTSSPSKRVREYKQVRYACSAWLGLQDSHGERHRVFEIVTMDEPLARYGGCVKS